MSQRSKIGNVRFRYLGVTYQGRLVRSSYPSGNDRVDVEVRDSFKAWEPFAHLSVDIPEVMMPRGMFAARDWGCTKGLAKTLEGQHLEISTKRGIEYEGFTLPVVRVVEKRRGDSGTVAGGKGTGQSP